MHYTGLSSSEEDASGDRTTRYFDVNGRVEKNWGKELGSVSN